MRLIKRPLFTALMALGVAFTAAAQQPPVDVPPTTETSPATSAAPPPADAMPDPTQRLTATDLEAWLDGFMPYALEQTDVAGSVVVVVKDGKVLLEKGYGFSDLAKRTPVDPAKTLFRPGSISKLFTWTAVMQLVEEGKLNLDEDVNKYLDFQIPAYNGKPVTLRNIMTHTTGMEEVIRGLIANDEKDVLPLDATLKHWIPERVYEPGSTPAYSNYATALAGYIVQRVSGQSFDDYIEQNIFQPLEMKNSTFRQPVQKNFLAMTSKGYKSASDGKEQPYEYINLAPAGSLASTGSDMGNFMIAHLQQGAFGDKRILREDTAREMHGTGQTSVGPLNKMMLGFYETTANGHRAIAHGGDTQWFHSDLQLFLDDNVGIYVSTNSSGKDGSARLIRDGLVTGFVNRYLPSSGPTSGGAGAGVDEATAKQHAAMIAGSYNSSRRADSNFMNLVYMLGQTKVSVNEDGTISVPMLAGYSGAPKKWKEISPFVWQDTNSGDRLAADVVDGKVTRFSAEPIASIMVFQRAAWWQTPAVFLTMLFGSLIALLLTVVAWPVSALVRRHYGAKYALAGADARAHRWVRIASLAVLASVGGMVAMIFIMMSDLGSMGPSADTMVILMRSITTILLPIGAAISLWNAWTVLRSNRRIWAKLWSVVIAASCLALLFVGIATHLVGFSANY
ncbi:beta-lactamase family protein [Lysobacter sp. A6]|uniref:Beta-lactamase family protein n=1 Tax=Noviluteimonas lactosilytica TaxID=2888523 RepID=A0ABS8JH85_9GAMM|nr:serine hydrolase domain-containing protein [Lysobacter lactosilyticus]MCC8362920.1 beta-lactamase family protein [Lysobacter lactosilyticus]